MATSEPVLSADSQVVGLLCTALALSPDSGLKPLSATEWSALRVAVHRSGLASPSGLLGASTEQLSAELALDGPRAERLTLLLDRAGPFAFELDRLAARGIRLLTLADDAYPGVWRDRLGRTAPPAVFVAGSAEALRAPLVAVVGSRDAEQGSLEFAVTLARRLAREGAGVVSGAARGIDQEAMLASADAGGAPVGIVAEALERVLRGPLRAAVEDRSTTLVSPYHPSARFSVGAAMGRNRLVYCLAESAVVVASGTSGGTRAGAIENLKAGWVPLSVRDDRAAAGNRDLIAAGARRITRDDLDREHLRGTLAPATVPIDRSPPQQVLFGA